MPKAIIGTVVATALLSGMASFSLVGMISYTDIDAAAGFADAFQQLGWSAAAIITEIGEILALPFVVFVSFLAQPRLQAAMAQDGLLPRFFGQLDPNGVIYMGTISSGAVLTLIALCVPFEQLNDAVSAGVLVSFSLCNCCQLNMRYRDASPKLCSRLISSFVITSGISAFLGQAYFQRTEDRDANLEFGLAIVFSLCAVAVIGALWLLCPAAGLTTQDQVFRAPALPFLPAAAVWINWFLLAQLSALGLCLICGWLSLALVSYAFYGYRHSLSHQFQESVGSVVSDLPRDEQPLFVEETKGLAARMEQVN